MDGNDPFNLDDHFIILWAKISQKKWSSPHSQQKCLKCSTWVQSQKRQKDLSLLSRQTIHHNNQIYALTTNVKEAEVEQCYEELPHILELTTKKMSFSSQGTGMQMQEVKRYLQEQETLTLEYKLKQGKANKVLPRERTGHSKHPLPATQEKTLHMDITRWSIQKSD